MVNNKLLISYGGMVALLPAKPFLILSAVGAIAVAASCYYLFSDDNEKKE